MKFQPGDRVRITAPDCELLKYEMIALGKAYGTILRAKGGKWRVEVEGTGSQDTEGHNCYADYRPDQLELMSRGPATDRIKRASLPPDPRDHAQEGHVLRYVFPASWKGTSCELDQMVREGRAMWDEPLDQGGHEHWWTRWVHWWRG